MSRTPQFDRKAAAESIVKALLPFVERHGTPVICHGALNQARPIQAKLPGLAVIYCPKASRLTEALPLRTLDIWLDGCDRKGKVFSVGLDPFVLYRLNDGEWIPKLLTRLNCK